MDAWLEDANGNPTRIQGTLSLGRSSKNILKLDSEEASRHHALIHSQGVGEFWLVDLGSTNGTIHRGRRIWQPVPLMDGDVIEICGIRLTFRRQGPPPSFDATARQTMKAKTKVRTQRVWLLLADIEGSSALSKRLPPEEFAMLVGSWFRACKEAVEAESGVINKYLGDGFLAHWAPDVESPEAVIRTLTVLHRLRESREPRFRVAVHKGDVAMIDDLMVGEDSMLGNDTHFIFRMEKLAGESKWPIVLSTPAIQHIQPLHPVKPLGSRDVPGQTGSHSFHTLDFDKPSPG